MGPEWTRASTLTLFANGEKVVEHSIREIDSKRSGLKFEKTWSLAQLGVDASSPKTFLVAVAQGPGITAAWWPIMPPYQPDSPKFEPYVMGVSPAVWLKNDAE